VYKCVFSSDENRNNRTPRVLYYSLARLYLGFFFDEMTGSRNGEITHSTNARKGSYEALE
jgi:hypothetical protein